MRKGCAKGLNNMITIKEYAEQKGVSHQAVYKQIQTHLGELEEHIITQGRTRYLTDEAVAILEKYRDTNVQIIERTNDKELIAELKQNIEKLLQRENELEREKSSLSIELKEVYKKQAEDARLVASAENNRFLLEEKTKKLQEQEQLYLSAKAEADSLYLQNQTLQAELKTFEKTVFGFFRKRKKD